MIQTHQRFKRTLIYCDTDTQSSNFRGRFLVQCLEECASFSNRVFALVVYTYIIPRTSKTRLWCMHTLTNNTQAYGRIARNSLFSCCSQGRSSVLGTVPFCEWIPQETVLPALQAVRCVLTINFPSALDPQGFHTRCGRPMRSAPKHRDSEYAIR